MVRTFAARLAAIVAVMFLAVIVLRVVAPCASAAFSPDFLTISNLDY